MLNVNAKCRTSANCEANGDTVYLVSNYQISTINYKKINKKLIREKLCKNVSVRGGGGG